jgi:hypothetical protein
LSSYTGRGAFELDDAHGEVKRCPCCDDSPLSLVAALGGEDDPPWCVGDLILFFNGQSLVTAFCLEYMSNSMSKVTFGLGPLP